MHGYFPTPGNSGTPGGFHSALTLYGGGVGSPGQGLVPQDIPRPGTGASDSWLHLRQPLNPSWA